MSTYWQSSGSPRSHWIRCVRHCMCVSLCLDRKMIILIFLRVRDNVDSEISWFSMVYIVHVYVYFSTSCKYFLFAYNYETLYHILSIICDRIWEKGPFRAKCDFLPFFKLSPFQGLKSPRLLAWFVSSMDLLLHRSNVRSLSKPPVPSGKPPKWGIKRRFSNAIDARARPAHTGSGRGPRFAASVVGWLKNVHARFEVHSYYGYRDISVLKWKFGNSAKWSLFSDPVTYV